LVLKTINFNNDLFIVLETMCSNSPKIMVFRPSLSEFKHFTRYIELMELEGAHKAGVAKVKIYL